MLKRHFPKELSERPAAGGCCSASVADALGMASGCRLTVVPTGKVGLELHQEQEGGTPLFRDCGRHGHVQPGRWSGHTTQRVYSERSHERMGSKMRGPGIAGRIGTGCPYPISTPHEPCHGDTTVHWCCWWTQHKGSETLPNLQ